MKRLHAGVIVLLLASSLMPLSAERAYADAISVNGWNYLSDTWGTAAAPVEVGPGSQNVVLSVTEQLFYANTATGVSATLTLPAGWTSTTGGPTVVSYLSGTVTSGTIVTFTFNLDVASNIPVGDYSFPITIAWGVTLSGSAVSLIQYGSVPVPLRGKVSLGFVSPQSSIDPGITNTVQIKVTNSGSGPATGLTITVSPGGGASVTTQPFKLGSLGINQSVTFSVGMIIPTSLVSSSLTLTLSGSYTDPYGNPQTVSQSLGIFVQNPAALSPLAISVVPPSLSAGQTNVISFTLLNSGTFPITDLAITFSSSSQQSAATATGAVSTSGATQVTLLSGSLFQATSLPSLNTITPQVQLFVGDSVVGSVAMTLSLSYYQGTIQKSETRTFGFIVTPDTSASFSPLSIKVTPATLLQGAYTNMSIAITNTAKTPIVALSVTPTITATGVTIIGPGIFQQNSLGNGATMTIPLQAYAPPTSPSSGQLQVALSYYVNNTLKQETRVIGVLFKGNIDLELTGTTVTPTVLSPGSAGSITLTITNLGATVAAAVTASAKLPAGFVAFGTTSTLIGDMQVDAPTTFTVSMTVTNGTAGGPHQIPVTFTYLDNLRTQTTKTVNVNVNVAGGAGAGGAFGGNRTGGATRTGVGAGGIGAATRTGTTQNIVTRYLPFPYLEIVIAAIALAGGFFVARMRYKPRAKKA